MVTVFPRSKQFGSIILASSDPVVASYIASELASTFDRHLKPIGDISLVKIEDDSVYYVDSMNVIYSVPLNSPKIQFFLLVASGKPSDALNWYAQFISHSFQ
jgi:hypothetical protein